MKNLIFHTFPFKRLGECTFWTSLSWPFALPPPYSELICGAMIIVSWYVNSRNPQKNSTKCVPSAKRLLGDWRVLSRKSSSRTTRVSWAEFTRRARGSTRATTTRRTCGTAAVSWVSWLNRFCWVGLFGVLSIRGKLEEIWDKSNRTESSRWEHFRTFYRKLRNDHIFRSSCCLWIGKSPVR